MGLQEDASFSDLSDVVSAASTPGQIADHIMASIAAGALPEGTRLPAERDLADALAVSRSSVRAALSTLERAGFVVRRRGRGGGTFISRVEAGRVDVYADRLTEFRRTRRDLLDARAIVQNRVAAAAADRRSDGAVVELRSRAIDYESARTAAEARTADARLHYAIAQAADNPHLVEIVQELDRKINAGFRHDPFSPSLFARACDDHTAIVDAIAAGRADDAGRLCEAHFRGTTMGGP
ncbi:FadR/GntR family transcriptional regulator [Brevibacterium jeotgali]|uniref:DNA-binding transcriptional regulator, FadR family n=1 Tax=Brevibacterium jeotgali TaxID=1262550 RepID=A0A2H1L889_9MICO|nr:FCD domain-containing protein [Brevibacterium jeotgali]TWC02740.1 GntR family transcriptional regulator [Brevibacterium jeotgali]SMY13124.1 DNA-binding transcriptional regulator, FadR family [Brevibacterium jeotgali]